MQSLSLISPKGETAMNWTIAGTPSGPWHRGYRVYFDDTHCVVFGAISLVSAQMAAEDFRADYPEMFKNKDMPVLLFLENPLDCNTNDIK